MERREIETSLGTVVLTGEFAGKGSTVVVIRGAYADEEMFARLPNILPDARILFGDIPGNRCPVLNEQSIKAYRAAYSAALASLERPVVVCGLSLGGVIALGLTSKSAGILAVDPPIRPTESSALQTIMRNALKRSVDAQDREFLANIFLSGGDYMPRVSQVTCTTIVLAGDHSAKVPSVLSDCTLEELARLPMVTVQRVEGVGHSVWVGGSARIVEALRTLLAEEDKQQSSRSAGSGS